MNTKTANNLSSLYKLSAYVSLESFKLTRGATFLITEACIMLWMLSINVTVPIYTPIMVVIAVSLVANFRCLVKHDTDLSELHDVYTSLMRKYPKGEKVEDTQSSHVDMCVFINIAVRRMWKYAIITVMNLVTVSLTIALICTTLAEIPH